LFGGYVAEIDGAFAVADKGSHVPTLMPTTSSFVWPALLSTTT
jgi:hypothetical protein